MVAIKDTVPEYDLIPFLLEQLQKEGWRGIETDSGYIRPFHKIVIGRHTRLYGVSEEKKKELDREFLEGNYKFAIRYAVGKHWLIQNPERTQIYGMATVIGAVTSVPTLIKCGILQENGDNVPDEEKYKEKWLTLLHSTGMMGPEYSQLSTPLFYIYTLDNFIGPKVQIPIHENPNTPELRSQAISNIGKPLPPKEDGKQIVVYDHLETTTRDFMRAALDLETFSKSIKEEGKHYIEARQSPIVPVKLREVRDIENYYEVMFTDYRREPSLDEFFESSKVKRTIVDTHSNWWATDRNSGPTLVEVEGYADEESLFVVMRSDHSAYYEYPHEVPSVPLFMGKFKLPPNEQLSDWEGHVAIFGGTTGFSKEGVYKVVHYDFIVKLEWESGTRADIDLHVHIDSNKKDGVYYAKKEYENDQLKMWLDIDYVGHVGRTREEHPEIVTIEKKQKDFEGIANVFVHNFNGGELSEDIVVTVEAIDGSFKQVYRVKGEILSGTRQCVYIADIDLKTGETTDKMEVLNTPWFFER